MRAWASALRQEGKIEEAIAEFRAALQLDPKNVAAHAGLGSALDDQHKYDEAIAEFRAALQLDPKNADSHAGLSTVLGDQHKYDEAIAEFRAGLSGNRAGLDRTREIARGQAVTGGFCSDRLIYPRACWSRYFPIGGNSQGPRLDCVLVRSSCPRGVGTTDAFWAGVSAMTTGDIFGSCSLSPANAGEMLPMLRAIRPARMTNFMISLLTHQRRACLPNLVDLAAYVDLSW
jgi:tetratricopeptide (TPR) repeat protein